MGRRALARQVSSISLFLTPEEATVAAAAAQVQVRDSRRLGGAGVLDQIWDRVGSGRRSAGWPPDAASMGT